jgi:hypothetical protein
LFDQLVMWQRADGSWDLTDGLSSALQMWLDAVESRMPPAAGIQQPRRVWATLLALAWLHLRAKSYQDEWTFLAGKAEGWLTGQAPEAVITAWRLAAEEAIVANG